MHLVSFDPLRTLGIPYLQYLKPERMFDEIDLIARADGLLFPEYWQVNTLVYALQCRIFPSLASYHIGHDKIEMSRCFQAVAPANVPWTLILANTGSNAMHAWEQMLLPFVAKHPRSSMGEGVFLIETRQQWQAYLAMTPVIYVQEYLPIDRDLRIVWVGDRIVGGYWRLQSHHGFHNNVARGGQIESGIVPLEAQQLVQRLAEGLGINHGGFDIAMVGGHPYVLEFNRLYGNQGLAQQQDKVNEALLDYLLRTWGESDPGKPRTPHLPRAI